MVSEEPKEGRCAFPCTDSVGLEVHSDELDEVFHNGDDGRLVAVVLEKGFITKDIDTHEEYIKFVYDAGYSLEGVKLRPEGDDESDPVHIRLPDDTADDALTNRDQEVRGYCEKYPMDEKNHCMLHGGKAPGAPEGNARAMTHGLKAKRSTYYEHMDDDDKMHVEVFVEDWLDLSPYDWDNRAVVNELYRIGVDQIRLWNAQDEMMDGFVYDQYEDMDMEGGEIETPQENPANLPYDRLDSTVHKKLKSLGCFEGPETQQAEATESLAEKFSQIQRDDG